MTSPRRAFSRFSIAAILTSFILSTGVASAEDNAAIRDHINRGNTLLARRQFQDAIAEYEAVLQLQPDYPIAKSNIALTHNNWGIFLYSQRKYAEAKEHWETSLKLNPRDGNVIRNLKIAETALARNPQMMQQGSNSRPTGPQDWNPFDESLDKVPKKPATAATTEPAPNVVSNTSSASGRSGPGSSVAIGASAASGLGATSTSTKPGSSLASSASKTDATIGSVSPTTSASSSDGANTEQSSGAVVILNGTKNSAAVTSVDPFSSPSSEPTPPQATPNFNTVSKEPTAVRIVGGTSGGASIVGGSTVSGGGKSFTPSSAADTTPPPFVPAKLPPKPSGGSVPMSWPGADEEHAPMTGKSTKTPGFLKSGDDEASDPANDANNVESLLEQIENKVYGKVTKNQPILKRIEKLEVDTLGKKKPGSVAERLKELKETYGL